MKIILLPIKYLFLGLIWLYKTLLSPWIPNSCRFRPSCSTYSFEAIQKYGPIKGSWLSVKRISRCHPWNPGGDDPVP